jgi:transcriptional regulator with XRE-family HTH domain
MQDKEYRHGFVNAQIEIDLPFQIRALRKQRELTQPQLADLTGMKQSRISKMEKPGAAHFTLETLRRLAKALDVALLVRFAPFRELVAWSHEFNPDSFVVPSFDVECQAVEEQRKALEVVRRPGKPVTSARCRIRQSRGRKHGANPKRFSVVAVPRKPVRAERVASFSPVAAGGEALYGGLPSGNNCTSPLFALVGSGNEGAGYAGRIGGLNGNR